MGSPRRVVVLTASMVVAMLFAVIPVGLAQEGPQVRGTTVALAAQSCHEGVPVTRARVCWVRRGKASRPLVVLFGDSHANHLSPGLARVAAKHDLRLLQLTKSGCPAPVVHTTTGAGDPHPQCFSWRESALDLIQKLQPDSVVLASSSHYKDLLLTKEFGSHVGDDYRETWRAGFEQTLQSLAGIGMVLVRDTPLFSESLPRCLARERGARRKTCGWSQGRALDPTHRAIWSIEAGASRGRPFTQELELTTAVCQKSFCSPVDPGGTPRYADTDHFTPRFSASLWRRLSQSLAGTLALPPSSPERVKAQYSRAGWLVRWKRGHPGSASAVSYRTTLRPTGKWRKRGAQTISCSGRALSCRSGKVPARATYKISVTAVSEVGVSPPARSRTGR